MKKFWTIVTTLIAVSIIYVLMLVFGPILTDFASSANATMAATSDMTNYPGTAGALTSMPWVMWWVPGVIAMIVIVVTLKRG